MEARVNPTMHMDPQGRETNYTLILQVKKMGITNEESRGDLPVEVFVGILGASQLTYVEAV